MSYSFSHSESSTFTITHARHMAAKVATDLKRMQRFYGQPSDTRIAEFETEVVEMLKAGYIDTVAYGFKRDGRWIEPTLRYTARELAGATVNDDDPGRVRANADISGAAFYSYMTYTAAWDRLSLAECDAVKSKLPFVRTGAAEPGISGYLSKDRVYSSGSRALERESVRSFA